MSSRTEVELSEAHQKILEVWKQVASETMSARHFNLDKKYTPTEAREQAEAFVANPDQESFEAFWNPLNSAQRGGSAQKIYEKWKDGGRTDAELADLIREILAAEEYNPSWQGELGARRTLWELFGFLHIEEYPIINGCAENGLSFFGYDCPSDYAGCADVFDEFRTVYESIVGHATAGTDHEVPINFEIDQLLNVIDKVAESDVERESNENVVKLYELVLEQSHQNKTSEPEDYKSISDATEDVLSKISHRLDGDVLATELVSDEIQQWSEMLSGVEPNATVSVEQSEQFERMLTVYDHLETELTTLAEQHAIGSINRASPPETVFIALTRDLQSRAGGRVNLNQVKWGVIQEEAYTVEGSGRIEPADNPPAERDIIAKQLVDTGQLVFYGPPGTGKTYTAQQFARWWITEQTVGPTRTEQLELTTFHPSFSYEDFIEGLTAKERDGAVEYVVEPGVFKEICKRAEQAYRNSDSPETAPPYVLIIDEINRGNLAQIFGELMTLLEIDKRLDAPNETRSKLAHSNESFVVPPNLYLIGTMNTADESIALLDAALRRRFRFYGFPPDFKKISVAYGFEDANTVVQQGGTRRDQLVAASILALTELNTRIRGVNQLGKGKQLGHSHLYGHDRATDVRDTWRFDILPQLEDYYFGKFDRLKDEVFNNAAIDLIDWDAERITDFSTESLYQDLCEIAGISEYAPLEQRLETDGSKQAISEDAWAAGERTPETFRQRIEQTAESPLRERLIKLWEIGDEIGTLDAGRGKVRPSVNMEIPEFDTNVGLFEFKASGKFSFRWNWLMQKNELTREDVESLRPILETIDSYTLEWTHPDDPEKDPQFEYPYLYLDEISDEEFEQLTSAITKVSEQLRTK